MINSTRTVRCYKCSGKTINGVSVNNPLGQDWCPMCDVFTVVDNTYQSTFQGTQTGRITRSNAIPGTIGKAEIPWDIGITAKEEAVRLARKQEVKHYTDIALKGLLATVTIDTIDPQRISALALDIGESMVAQQEAREELNKLISKE